MNKYDQSFINSIEDGVSEAYIYLEDIVTCEPKIGPVEVLKEERAIPRINKILSDLSLPLAVKEMGYKRSFFRCERVTVTAVLLLSEIAEVGSILPPLLAVTCTKS